MREEEEKQHEAAIDALLARKDYAGAAALKQKWEAEQAPPTGVAVVASGLVPHGTPFRQA